MKRVPAADCNRVRALHSTLRIGSRVQRVHFVSQRTEMAANTREVVVFGIYDRRKGNEEDAPYRLAQKAFQDLARKCTRDLSDDLRAVAEQ